MLNYLNGNCFVSLAIDGTKAREWAGRAAPSFPESIDLKITSACDGGCPWCHESSTKRGRHARREDILNIVAGLPPGVEIALGGGDTFCHPDVEHICRSLSERGLVVNATVNGFHVERHLETITRLRESSCLTALGVSCSGDSIPGAAIDENTVLHFIVGVHEPEDVLRMTTQMEKRKGLPAKVLLLGYKDWGRGRLARPADIATRILRWRFWLPRISRAVSHVAFDNLALTQLLPTTLSLLSGENYMGDEGEFTMFVDAVEMAYAKSSTMPRTPLMGMTAREAFRGFAEQPDEHAWV